MVIRQVQKKSTLTEGGYPLYKNANFYLRRSHAQDKHPYFLAPPSPLPDPKYPIFPPSIHTSEHLLKTMTLTCPILPLLGTLHIIDAMNQLN